MYSRACWIHEALIIRCRTCLSWFYLESLHKLKLCLLLFGVHVAPTFRRERTGRSRKKSEERLPNVGKADTWHTVGFVPHVGCCWVQEKRIILPAFYFDCQIPCGVLTIWQLMVTLFYKVKYSLKWWTLRVICNWRDSAFKKWDFVIITLKKENSQNNVNLNSV